jgi:hypothetical protein
MTKRRYDETAQVFGRRWTILGGGDLNDTILFHFGAELGIHRPV